MKRLRGRLARQDAPRTPWIGAAIVVTLVIGAFATHAVRGAADARERAYLLRVAQTAATAIDPASVQELAGAPADLSAPEYAVLKGTLEEIRAANPDVRFAYLMGSHGGDKLFFYADSEPAGTPDESRPGDVYQDTTADELVGFREGRPFVEGPVRDQWGEWVSAFAPINDPVSRRTVAILGLDIGTRLFHQRVRDAAVLPVAATLIVVGALLAYWLYARRSRRHLLEVAQEREIFRVVLEDMPIGVIVARYPGGEIILENPQAWSMAHRKGRHARIEDYRFLDADGKPYPSGEVPLAVTLETGEKVVKADLFVGSPGSLIPLRAESAPVRDAAGRIRFAVMVLEEHAD